MLTLLETVTSKVNLLIYFLSEPCSLFLYHAILSVTTKCFYSYRKGVMQSRFKPIH